HTGPHLPLDGGGSAAWPKGLAKLGGGAGRQQRQKSSTLPPIPLTRLGLRPIHPLPERERNKGLRRSILLPLGEKVARQGRMRGMSPQAPNPQKTETYPHPHHPI